MPYKSELSAHICAFKTWFAPVLVRSLELASICGILEAGNNGDPLAGFDNGSKEGNGVRNEKELVDGEAKIIGLGEEGVVEEDGVSGEAKGESKVLAVILLGFSLE